MIRPGNDDRHNSRSSGVASILILLVLGCAIGSAQTSPLVLSGKVKDQNDDVILGAQIRLSNENGFEAETVTDRSGEFLIINLSKGKHTLRILARGFAEYKEEIELDTKSVTRTVIVLYPIIRERVEIDERSDRLRSEASSGTITLTEEDLAALPDDPDQLREQLQQLAAVAGGEPGNAPVTVDGLRSDGRLPPKSSISQVRINPNPYSAEHQTTPRGGQIEITTKPGSQSPSGSAFFNLNDAIFNARNPFASKRGEMSKYHYGFSFGGPIVKDKSGYFLDLEKRDIDEIPTVSGLILDKDLQVRNFTANSPSPERLLSLGARVDWLINPENTLVIGYNFNRNELLGQGIGGTSLPERGVDEVQTQSFLRVSETAVISPKIVNEFRMGFTLNKVRQAAVSNSTAIDVAGGFVSGGADLQNLERDESLLEIVDHTTFSIGNHELKSGVQIFNNRVSEVRAENTNGTFFFGGTEYFDGSTTVSISSIEQYRRTLLNLPGGVPTRFTVTQGAPKVSADQWTFGGFVQDEWKIHPQVQLSYGIRFEAQTSPNDGLRLAPRVGIAYSPDKKQKWVLRARAGIYFDRIGTALPLETGRLDGENQQQVIIDSPSFPDPFLNGVPINLIPTTRTVDPMLRSPTSATLRLELERQLPKGWTFRSSHSWSQEWAQLRSRNINAPFVGEQNPDPHTAPRPFGIDQNILQFESSGRTEGSALFLGISQFRNRRYSINLGYLHLDYRTNTDGPFSLPQSGYVSINDFGRTTSQSNHRLFFSGRLRLLYGMTLSGNFNAASGRHFDVTTGRDNNGDGNFKDRPGITSADDPGAVSTPFGMLDPGVVNGNLGRNVGITPAFVVLNLSLSRSFGVGKKDGNGKSPYDLTATVTADNVFNRSNLTGNIGVLRSPLFNQPTRAFSARRIEFGLRFSF